MNTQGVADRGVLSRYVRLWVLEKFGADGIERVTGRLSPAARLMFTKPVPHEWYPVELVKEVYQVVYAEFSEQYPETSDSLGAFIAEHSVKGFLQYLVRLISMNRVLERLGAIWKRYHRGGTAEAEVTSRKGKRTQGYLRVSDYDAGPAWCSLMTSYIKTFAESTGATNVEVEKRDCIHKGDKTCSWQVSWED